MPNRHPPLPPSLFCCHRSHSGPHPFPGFITTLPPSPLHTPVRLLCSTSTPQLSVIFLKCKSARAPVLTALQGLPSQSGHGTSSQPSPPGPQGQGSWPSLQPSSLSLSHQASFPPPRARPHAVVSSAASTLGSDQNPRPRAPHALLALLLI